MAVPQGRDQAAAEHWNDCLQQLISLVALIDNDQHILLLKRPDHLHCGGLWSLPGGKQQHNESPLACAQRELREETGARGQQWQQRHQWLYHYPDRTLHFTLFQAGYDGTPLRCESHHQWQPITALNRINLPPANRAIAPLDRWLVLNQPE
ncbi:MAG: NUDIX domain-containing protein [Mariprofundales bacterium]